MGESRVLKHDASKTTFLSHGQVVAKRLGNGRHGLPSTAAESSGEPSAHASQRDSASAHLVNGLAGLWAFAAVESPANQHALATAR
jgi:hypothetical protein